MFYVEVKRYPKDDTTQVEEIREGEDVAGVVYRLQKRLEQDGYNDYSIIFRNERGEVSSIIKQESHVH